MDAVFAAYVVLFTRVGEIIYLFPRFDAGLDKTQAVLPHHGVVYGSLANQP